MKIHIDKYKNHGVRFAIDDFGTGYSNLNLVTALDVDEIKIDKSLTSAIGTESLRYDLLPDCMRCSAPLQIRLCLRV